MGIVGRFDRQVEDEEGQRQVEQGYICWEDCPCGLGDWPFRS